MLDQVAPKSGRLAEDMLRFVAGQLRDPMIALSLHQHDSEPCLLASLNVPEPLARDVMLSVDRDLEREQDPAAHAWLGTVTLGSGEDAPPLVRTTLRCRVDPRRSLALTTCSPETAARNSGQITPRIRSYIELMLQMLWEAEEHRRWGHSLAGMLNSFDVAILLLEESGHVSFANERARDLLTRSEGIRKSGGAIAACDLETSIRLQTLVRHALDIRDGAASAMAPQLLLLPRQGKAALVATVSRLPPDDEVARAGIAAICILDPDRNSCAMAEALFRAYGLTQSEAHLAVQIVAGLSLNDAAVRMRVSQQTARTYLKQAFWKTGTHRQADLVRRVLNSVVRISQLA